MQGARLALRCPCRHHVRWNHTAASDGGYKSIGSFHSENLAELLRQSDETYRIPDLPFDPMDGTAASPRQSHSVRDDFLLDLNQWTFLNHGAFGAALRVGYDRAAAWRLHLERQPLRYFDRDLLPHLVYAARRLADCMGNHTNSDDGRSTIALLPNVTAGLNAVMVHHVGTYGTDAHCVVWDTTYGSVKTMAQRYFGDQHVSTIPFQADYLDKLASNGKEAFHLALQSFLDSTALQDKRLLFIIDHTTSNTALTLPIHALAQQIHDHHPTSIVVVDGAHGLWAQPPPLLQQDDTHGSPSGPSTIDAYVTNGHKWLSAPRGVGAMVVANPQLVEELVPVVQSHAARDEPDLFTRFVWDGCRDYAAALAVPAVLDYWGTATPTRREQCRATLRDGIDVLARDWHGVDCPEDWPGRLTLASFDSGILSTMGLVRIPRRHPLAGSLASSTDAKKLQDYLHSQNIEVPIKCINGELFVRLSAHVYNEVKDFDILSKACLKLWDASSPE